MDVRKKLVKWLCEAMILFDKRKDEKGINPFEVFADNLIAHGVTVQEWIAVEDRLPEIDAKYLVARAEGGRYSISVRKFRKEVPCWYTGYCGHWERRTNGITHWMTLPKPPRGE